jgi:hypothetical protein
MAAASEEKLEYEIGENEEETTVEVESAEEASEEVEASAEKPEAKDDELEQYSEGVQKRINKLTARLREHQRREQAALDYAKSVQAKAQELEQKFRSTDSARMSEAKNRVETQVVALKQIIKKAREEGDFDTETEAHERLTQVMWEQQKLRDAEAQYKAQQEMREAQRAAPQQQPQQAPRRQPDPRAEEWAERNPWFGQDTVMTHAAWGIHAELVQNEGFDPQSDEYYHELDSRIRANFPNKFAKGEANNRATNKPVQTVAPATRSSGVTNTARRTVRLSPSQVAIAKKLGVPLDEYAKYVKE